MNEDAQWSLASRRVAVKKYLSSSLLCFTGLFKLQDLVKSPPSVRTEMYIRQAGPKSYRQVLREVRHKEIFKLIIDTDPAHMQQFFRAVSSKQFDIRHRTTDLSILNLYFKTFYLSRVRKKDFSIISIFYFPYRSCSSSIMLKILLYFEKQSKDKIHISLIFPHRLISRMINLTSCFIQMNTHFFNKTRHYKRIAQREKRLRNINHWNLLTPLFKNLIWYLLANIDHSYVCWNKY